MHPLMRQNYCCATAVYEDSDDYEAQMDYLEKDSTTAEWKSRKSVENSKK